MQFASARQNAELDDNGNGVSDLLDGLASSSFSIGSGILLAGDEPLIESLQVNVNLASDFEVVRVDGVTSTGAIDRVVLTVRQPDGTQVEQQLIQQQAGVYSARSLGLCGPTGDYDVAVFAVDDEGLVSPPVSAVVNRAGGDCTDFLYFNGFE